MFDFVHERRKLVQIVLVLITLPFAFFGLESYRHSGGDNAPATVNGTKISQQEFDQAFQQQQDRMRQALGANFDPAMLDTPELKQAIIDTLVARQLLIERAKSSGLTVTDDQVAQVIGGIDAFKKDGKFDKARYTSLLESKNMSPLMFEAKLREDLLVQQLRDSYAQNGYASKEVAGKIIAINEQQRVIGVSKVSLQSYLSQVKVDDTEIKNYYDQHQSEFKLPEQARVDYLIFSINDLMAKVDVKDADVRKYYDERQSEFGSAEQRQAAHILIAVATDAPQADKDAAKAKAEALLKQVRQNPEKFAELAKQNSQDPGSAANGGDLGWFGHGMMVKAFDDAVFTLKPGEISGVVQTDFGYHIIKLVGIKPSKTLPFDEVKAGIISKLRQQKAADSYAELAEKFSNTVYEQSDSLQPAADLTGGKIQQSGWMSKGSPAGDPWNAKVMEAVFSDDAVKNKRNTAAIEVAPNTLLAAHVVEHKPASLRALAEVQESIKQILLRKKALDMAEKQGKMLLAQLQQGEKPAMNWAVAESISHAQHGALDAAMVRQIFQVDAAKLPQYVGAESQQEGYLIVRVEAVKEAEQPSEMKRSKYVQQLRQMTGEELFKAYLKDLQDKADIKINLPKSAKEAP
ncbi:MAG: SurA N-terminal domain-containing protein [Gallionella sp.]|nr:SurA N-terminal domain-containing protein [Gallionella sp.]MDD4947357.1 SurA N-terminal domain-containing protein [Gallionella sp.]MDD5612948.1 SurA N-terminal domain-containing protein [Gallionella sp.]